jgi:hypothetical protein
VFAALLVLGALGLGLGLFFRPPLSRPATLEGLTLTVRRDQIDDRKFAWPLVRNGKEEVPRSLDPLGPKDDFRLDGRLDRPAPWYLLWFDTRGAVTVAASPPAPQADVRYPERIDRMQAADPADPHGVHLLVLVVGPSPADQGRDLLAQNLRDVGRPPQALPQPWAVPLRPRGPGEESETAPGPSAANYLETIAARLPAGLRPVHAVFLRTWKPQG